MQHLTLFSLTDDLKQRYIEYLHKIMAIPTKNDNSIVPSKSNTGFDLFFPSDVTIPPHEVKIIPLGIKAKTTLIYQTTSGVCHQDVGFLLLARSSISKTPLMIANGIGLIDSSYRGEICVALRNVSDKSFLIKEGERLCQLVPISDGKPFSKITLVETEDEIQESHNVEMIRTIGFGSSGI